MYSVPLKDVSNVALKLLVNSDEYSILLEFISVLEIFDEKNLLKISELGKSR